jgi:putative transposase
MKRARSRSRLEKDAFLLAKIQDIKANHPLWGYRRVWAYLRYRQAVVVGKNTVCRIMKENALLIQKNTALRAKRTSSRPKPRAKVPNQYWGTDMTKVKIQGWGWLYIHIVIDWYSKEIIGYHASLTSKASDWLDALNMAVNVRFPQGILDHKGKPKLISDNGCQPTSKSFMKTCSQLKIKQIFTSWNNPKGNADTERFFRTLKEDLVWINDWDNPFDCQKDFQAWIQLYNADFPHQSLKNLTPAQFFDVFIKNRALRKESKSKNYSLLLA